MNYSHVIITWSKMTFFITPEQEKKLRGLNLNDEININGSIIKAKDIQSVPTTSKYYEAFPDKIPAKTAYYKIPSTARTQYYSEEKHINRIRKMKESFLIGVAKARGVKEVSPNQLSSHKRKIYDNMETKLQELQGVDKK